MRNPLRLLSPVVSDQQIFQKVLDGFLNRIPVALERLFDLEKISILNGRFTQDLQFWIESTRASLPYPESSLDSARFMVKNEERDPALYRISFNSGSLPFRGRWKLSSVCAAQIITLEKLTRGMNLVDVILELFASLPRAFLETYFQQWDQYQDPVGVGFQREREAKAKTRPSQDLRDQMRGPEMFTMWDLRPDDAQQFITEGLKKRIASLTQPSLMAPLKKPSFPSKSITMVPPSRKRLIELE